MDLIHTRSCGLDVHKKNVVACVLATRPDGSVERQMRTFKTVTADLLDVARWLDAHSVTHVAMESTGVYWRPVFNVLRLRHSEADGTACHSTTAIVGSPCLTKAGCRRWLRR